MEEGFSDFLSRLTPNGTETEAASNHRESILSCLKNNFTVYRLFRTGSFGNGTSICGRSDVDYFVSIKTDELKENSANTLRTIREILEKRFPSTYIYVDSPSVVLSFGDGEWERTEITPADYRSGEVGKFIYEIPDGNQGWMRSSPDTHNSYVDEINIKYNYRVKKLIRFIKAWKYFRNVSISSFYLELFTTRYASTEESILYYWDIRNIFKKLYDNQLSMMQDQMGISGYISPCKTETQKAYTLSKLESAMNRSDNALTCFRNGNIEDAFYWWNLLYNGNFPAYRY